MKESEPKMIVCKIAETEQQECLGRREEPSRPTCSTPRRSTDDSHSNSALSTTSLQLGYEEAGILFSGQRANMRQCPAKALRMPGTALDCFTQDFAPPEPGCNGRWS